MGVVLNVESDESPESAPMQTQSRPKRLAISSLSINIMYEVASRPTAGRLGDILSDRQSV